MKLPQEFTERMQRILGTEYAAFEKSYQEERKYGLRVNTKKISPGEFERIAPFHLTPIPWIPGGYYYQEEDAPARHPFYYAGLYYLQEPSAMTPASVLPIEKGDRVLDLCAAPGGKATALGAKLGGTGLLVANDISASRCKALLKNIEVFGIPNSFVTNAVPARLAECFPEFFDKILVDAPCSGEGMFRKDADVIRAWYPEKPEDCAKLQKEIVLQAVRMLRPGGLLLYSTCTFAPEENEAVIGFLLSKCPDLELLEIPYREGFSKGLFGMERCVRLWPHKLGGEGHFLALLRKRNGEGQPDASDPERESAEYESAGRKPAECEPAECEQAEYESAGRQPAECGQAEYESAGRKPAECEPAEYGSAGRKPAECEQAEYESAARQPAECGQAEYEPACRGLALKNGTDRAERAALNESRGKGKKARRRGTAAAPEKAADGVGREQREVLEEFLKGFSRKPDPACLEVRGTQVYYVPGGLPPVSGIPFLRNGLYLGELKKGRFEPSQSLAMALRAEDYSGALCLEAGDERLLRYLRGETIEIAEGEAKSPEGWKLVCADRYPLGWGKLVNGLLKNKYHPGWRMK